MDQIKYKLEKCYLDYSCLIVILNWPFEWMLDHRDNCTKVKGLFYYIQSWCPNIV